MHRIASDRNQIGQPFYSHRGRCEPLTSRLPPLAASQYQYSNRHTYEKLEVELRHLLSAKVPVLIDTKTHFIQGKNAHFQCTNPKSAQTQEGGFLSTRRLSADPVRFAVACSPLVTRH